MLFRSGKRTGIFGSVRIMNGQPRNPHNGEDIGAPMGADVAASNDGVVRLTVDHVFSGRGVFVDHGLGFYTMYFHLSDVLVKDGDLVTAGQIIGKVGATGRATGPHLHTLSLHDALPILASAPAFSAASGS